jgi:anaerobic ribonucleoside-triphosphate reductase activating protein
MYYGAIKKSDIANGEGIRTSLFVSGCRNGCKNCFNKETWAFDYGQPFGADTVEQILSLLRPDYIRGLTLLGGEPMEPDNQRALLPLLSRVREELPKKDIWCYSGYTLEELLGQSRARCEVTDQMLSYIDVLVDGEFVEEKRNITLKFRGSENQRLIDLKKTLAMGQIVLYDA